MTFVYLVVVPVFMIVIAVVLYRAGAAQSRAAEKLWRTGTHAQAEVVGFEIGSVSRGPGEVGSTTVYYPVVRFTTAQGVVEAPISTAADHKIANEGEIRAIVYDPNDPTNLIMTDSKLDSANIGAVIPKVMSIFLIVVAVGMLLAWALYKFVAS